MAAPDRTELRWPEWDKLGEEEVARKWADGSYAPEDRPAYDEWIRRKQEARDQEEKKKEDEWRTKELSCTVSAKNAAWVAAGAAILGALISLVLLVRSCSETSRKSTQQKARAATSDSAPSAESEAAQP